MDIGPELASQVFSTAKKVPMEQKEPRLFDEAQSILHKEPLPYLAGFSKQYTQPQDESKVKLPRYCLFCLVFVFFFSSENVAKQFWGVYLLLPEFVGRTLRLTQPFSSS